MTKKEIQEQENAEVAFIYGCIERNIRNFGMTDLGRLRSCNATVHKTYGFTLLKSYNTIVAAIDDFGVAYDFLRLVYGYTATSSQHITKFFKDYNVQTKWVWREL